MSTATNNQFSCLQFFFRDSIDDAETIALQIQTEIKELLDCPSASSVREKKDLIPGSLVVVLGGDGSILQAAALAADSNSTLLGLNLGTMGFLTAIDEKKDFVNTVKQAISGELHNSKRLQLKGTLQRNTKDLLKGYALNEILIQSLIGVVDLDIFVDGNLLTHSRGSGVMVATPTGSTAYNVSAHGPVVAPEVNGMLITALLSHGYPVPSTLVDGASSLTIKVKPFRETNRLTLKDQTEHVDVALSFDGRDTTVLKAGDVITITKSKRYVHLLVPSPNRFYTQLHKHFGDRH